MSQLTFRDATLSDAPRLVEIYRYYVEKTAISFEWETPSVEEFQSRMKAIMTRYPYLVAELDGKITGYSYVHAFVGRQAYDWSVETTIYLDSDYRHQHIGTQLYARMEERLKKMHIINLNACIGYPSSQDQPDAQLMDNSARFHEHLGYRLVGEFHKCGYKFGRWYDMIWMEKMIGDHPAHPEKVLNYKDITL